MIKALLATVLVAAAGMAAAQSNIPIPGTDTLGRGFDMVKGTQNGTAMGVTLLPIFEWTYSQGQTWTDPTDTSLVWSVPDQLVVTNVDMSVENVNYAIMNTFDEWISYKRSSFNVDAGVSIGSGTKAFSLNFKYDHESATFMNQTVTHDSASGFSQHFWALYQLESYPPEFLTLNFMFNRTIQMLPQTINSAADQAKYNELIQYWGTHFVSMANFGGDVHVATFVDKSLFTSHSYSWVENQFALTFHYYIFQISAGGFTNHSQIHISQEFQEAAHTYVFYRGGDLTLQNNNTAGSWVSTIPQDPVYLNCTIADLATLFESSNPQKAATLRGVITSYIMNGVLPDTDDTIDYPAYYASLPSLASVTPKVDRVAVAPKPKTNLRG